jgi:hypothetical protein
MELGQQQSNSVPSHLIIKRRAKETVRPDVLEFPVGGGKNGNEPPDRRIDALVRANENTVCVYDIKTGRSGLSHARILELLVNVAGAFPDATRIIITEVRPADRWHPGRRPQK